MSERSALPSWATMSAIICCATVLPTLQAVMTVRLIGSDTRDAVAFQAGSPAFRQSRAFAANLQEWATWHMQNLIQHIQVEPWSL